MDLRKSWLNRRFLTDKKEGASMGHPLFYEVISIWKNRTTWSILADKVKIGVFCGLLNIPHSGEGWSKLLVFPVLLLMFDGAKQNDASGSGNAGLTPIRSL